MQFSFLYCLLMFIFISFEDWESSEDVEGKNSSLILFPFSGVHAQMIYYLMATVGSQVCLLYLRQHIPNVTTLLCKAVIGAL